MFTRTLFPDLKAWLTKPDRKPLVLRGARQVGKSTAVREFARREGRPLYEVNLERHAALDAVFAGLDIARILQELSFACGKTVAPEGILFLDEIQATPQALRALRYFREERPDLPVIAAGSLLEFTLDAADFSMPVGRVTQMHMGPLGFTEFLGAMGEDDLAALLAGWTPGQPFPATAHARLLPLLREYLLVGGMPEAVATFARTRAFADCHEVHLSILDTYRDDFGKYAGRVPVEHVRRVFDHVPAAVGGKFGFARAIPEARAAQVRQAFDLLATAGVVHAVRHCAGNGVPLGAEADGGAFKPLFLDIGLLNAACGVRALALEALRDAKFVNEGRMAEQVVGQNLLAGQGFSRRPVLHYWLREGRSANAEVDYLVEAADKVLPVEVKAGAGGSLKSLHVFMAAKQAAGASPLAVRLDLNPPAEQIIETTVVLEGKSRPVRYPLRSLPLYMADQVGRMGVG